MNYDLLNCGPGPGDQKICKQCVNGTVLTVGLFADTPHRAAFETDALALAAADCLNGCGACYPLGSGVSVRLGWNSADQPLCGTEAQVCSAPSPMPTTSPMTTTVTISAGAGLADDDDDDDSFLTNLIAPCLVTYDYKTCLSTQCGITTDDDDDDGDDDDDDGDDDDDDGDDDDDAVIATCADAAASPGFLDACVTWPAEIDSVCPACSSLMKGWVGCVYSTIGTFVAFAAADDTVETETCAFTCPSDVVSGAGAAGKLGAAAFGLCLAAAAL